MSARLDTDAATRAMLAAAPTPRRHGQPLIDMLDAQVGRWTVVARAAPIPGRDGAAWLCRCACGTERVLPAYALRGPRASGSCGCGRRQKAPQRRPQRRPQRAENLGRMGKRALAVLAAERPEAYRRPRTYAECQSAGLGTEVPCPFVGCAHHLYLEVNDRFGPSASVQLNFPDREPDELAETCVLALADRGPLSQAATAAAMNVSDTRVMQIERAAMARAATNRVARSLAGAGGVPEVAEPDDGSGAATGREAIAGLTEFACGDLGWLR